MVNASAKRNKVKAEIVSRSKYNDRARTGPQMIHKIVPQMIPGPEMIPTQKVRNGVDSMKSLWMDTYFLNPR